MSTSESNGNDRASSRSGVDGGFTNPVFDSQAIFAGVMQAMSRPGTPVDLGSRVRAPHVLAPAAASILAALADYDTPVWLDEGLRHDGEAGRWVSFQTGAILVADPARARFAVCSARADVPNLSTFAIGTPDYPDRSATLIVMLESLDGGPALRLSGPGIETSARIAPKSLSPVFFADWAINNALFPRGVDVLLVAGSQVIGLPRTTKIRSA
ncbi:carbon-phosphorus lyase subunit PhnH [Aureimonas sp. SA4125]|uniref:phosphonate C-P lyase system protein PhnH n=1 Tax=Aureimonas sp. SA4125 TaxID=2826993 RepID=UPI001CC77FD5|nr:phosphonate C-P lyase system protein PhnH [Aureimonas sp. SA4125]BDA85642.1 carbon-phosphorus lyase subunit PhnH [Aureimonas sp. SA4125]